MTDDVRDAVEHGWRELAEIDAALERGEIDEAGWHDAVLARRRCPQWADRIWTANALGWHPPRWFDYVRTGLDCVSRRASGRPRPAPARPRGGGHGRLLVGVTNERRDEPGLADDLLRWGFTVAATATRPHGHEALERRVHWLDGESHGARQ